LVPTSDSRDDLIGFGGPDKGSGLIVGLAEEAVDRGLELDDRAEGAAFEPTPGQLGEEALHGVEPGGRGRGEMEDEPRMPTEPGANFGMLVGGVVVEDEVDDLGGRNGGLDGVEEANELLVAVA